MRITPIRRLHSLELLAFTDFSYINIWFIYNIKVSLPKWPKWWIFSPIFRVLVIFLSTFSPYCLKTAAVRSTASPVESHFPNVHLNFAANCRIKLGERNRTVTSAWDHKARDARFFFPGFRFSSAETRWRRPFIPPLDHCAPVIPEISPEKSRAGVCRCIGRSRLPVCVLKALIWPR